MKKSDSNRLQSTAIEELDGGSAARLPSTAIEGNRVQSAAIESPRRQSGRPRSGIAALAALLFAAPSALAAGPAADSAPMRLDLRESPRLAADGETFALAYSPRWGGASSCSIAADGTRLLSNATDAGTLPWTARGVGRHALSFTAGALVYDAAFTVLGENSIAIDCNRLQSNATWTAGKTWVVTAPLTVPSGVTLTIEPGAVVKFMDGAGLAVESGGACIARGVVFTHVADDTAGGDTMMDGDGDDGSPGTARPTMGAYTITGVVTDDDATEYRYMPPQTLTSSISSDTRLRGHRCYIVSNSVTVASGATLTLQPGTVIKFNTGCQMTVNGTLSAQGTRAAPIVFTSLKDDEHGGDTNGDGEKTYAAGGDWNGVWVNGRADFAYTELMYSGNGNERGIIQTQSSGVLTMTGCTVAHALNDGIWNWGGSISVTNTVFIDLGWATAPYRGSKNEYVNCVFYGNDVGLCYWSHWTGAPTYRNCIFASCAHGWCELASGNYGDPPSSVTVANCVFFNPDGYRQQSTAFDGKNGNLYADPLFLDPESGDFRIAANSPCVDAADSAAAPELDFYGQPRTTVRPAPLGTPDALGRNADIGIHEFYPSNAPGVYDLSAKAVATTATSAAPGESIAVTWTVGNAGKRAVPDPWHDALYLVSDSGKSYALGEPLNPGALAAGASRETTATFPVPVVPAGSYRLRLAVNSRRSEIPEGSSTGNNAALSETSVAIAILATAASDGAIGSVAPGAAKVVAFDIPSGSGDLLLRVSAPAGGSEFSARVGLGFQPTDSGSGTALAFANGESWLMVPAGTERVYLVVENGGASAVSFSADFRAGSLSLASVSPSSLPASGAVTLQIAGAGFGDGCAVLVGGSSAAVKAVRCVSSSLLAATIDCAKLSAGSRLALSVAKGAETKTLENAIAVTTAAGKGKFWAKLNVPDSVREGRLVSTCFIEYGNSGTADVLSPVLQVAMDGNGTLGYVGGLSGQNTLQFVAAGGEGSAGVLRPGESRRIRFALRAGSSNGISLRSSVGSDYAPAPWTSAADYLAGLSAAATRIGLRGQDATDYALVFDLAKAMKNGEPTSAIFGRVIDEDGAGVANVDIVADDEDDEILYRALSNESGVYAVGPLPAGTYLVAVNGMEQSIQVGDGDVAVDFSVDGTTRAIVRLDSGFSDAMVTAYPVDGEEAVPAVSTGEGLFAIRGVPDGVYRIEAKFGDLTGSAYISIGGDEIVEAHIGFAGSCAISGTIDGLEEGDVPLVIVSSGENTYTVAVNADGAFSLPDVPAGEYCFLHVSTAAVESGDEEPVVIAAGEHAMVSVARNGSGVKVASSARMATATRSAASESEDIKWYQTARGVAGDLVAQGKTLWSSGIANAPEDPSGIFDCIHNREKYASDKAALERFTAELIDFEKAYNLTDTKWLWIANASRTVGFAADIVGGIYMKAKKALAVRKLKAFQKAVVSFEFAAIGLAKDEAVIAMNEAVGNSVSLADAINLASDAVEIGDQLNLLATYMDQISRGCTKVRYVSPKSVKFVSEGLQVVSTILSLKDAWEVGRGLGETTAQEVFSADNLKSKMPRFRRVLAEYGEIFSKFNAYHCCPDEYAIRETLPTIDIVAPFAPQSWDPNEMAGPLGTGANRSVLPGDWCEYTVYFENQTNATAAAAEVRVTAHLDPSLDWSSFEMVGISFGDQTDAGLEGKANGTSEHAVPGTNYTVRSEVSLDTETGSVSWYLRIVDPDGDEDGWPLDVYGGFLPPNDPETHCGEGHITYRVKVRDDAAPGARIDASATIVFDYNDPIPTDPAWWNTVAAPAKIVFSANGGTGSMDGVFADYEGRAALPANSFKRADYSFAGWATSPGGKAVYKDKWSGATGLAWGDTLTLYAVWTPTTYTVKFSANGGKGTMAAQKFARGATSALRANAFARSGYTFIGWSKSASGAVAYANKAKVRDAAAAGKTLTLYAQWAKSKYSVKFNAYGGKLPKGRKMAAQTMAYGKAAKLRKNAFTRSGYVFAGWATSKANAKKGVIAYKNAQSVKNLRVDGKATTLYAVWAKPKYKVAFYANGGKGATVVQTLKYGKAAKLAKCKFKAPKGRKFAGWATSAANAKAGKVKYKNAQAVKNLIITGKTVKLYAVWKMK